MLNGPASEVATKEQLSALVDGELAASAVAGACVAWKESAELRASWHRYQLIGDVLRSAELATDAARDRAFLDGVRARLAAEPVVLAPEPLAPEPRVAAAQRDSRSARRGRWAWAGPSAVAAGFAAVAGALLVTRLPAPTSAAPQQIARSAPAVTPATALATTVATVAPASTSQPVGTTAVTVSSGSRALIRDPQLDRYLAAHRQFAAGSAIDLPSGYLRNANVEVTGR